MLCSRCSPTPNGCCPLPPAKCRVAQDLLRVARWFDEATPDDAHDTAVAAIGLHGARHLGVPPSTDEVVPAYPSWWTGPVVEVPVALRERGSRAQRGRASADLSRIVRVRSLTAESRTRTIPRERAGGALAPYLPRTRRIS
ncbi:DUF2397 family protein [Streptomyces sp. NPDC000151]|uniref:DUF2397 family protein n=1 Tax=Streptomyces sp. NPDC000151 TaxID=3154244 RepID=UPI0033296B20